MNRNRTTKFTHSPAMKCLHLMISTIGKIEDKVSQHR